MKPAIVVRMCLVALACVFACSEDSRPPPLGDHAYTCKCTCDRCVRRDPTTGMCIEFARDTRLDAICSDAACGTASSDPLAGCTEKCERVGDNCAVTVDGCVDSFCTGSSSEPLIAGGEPTSSVLAVLPASSRAVLSVSGEHAATPLSGQIRMTGGECPGSSCSLRFDYIRMTGADFEIDGHPIADCQTINDGGFSTTVNPDGTFLVPSGDAAFFFHFVLDGELSGLRLANDGPMTGKIDFAADTLTLTASGSAEDASVDLFITGQFTNRPPTAAAGPDLTVECTLPHRGVVPFDASGTTDPDGLADLAVHGWLEDFDTAGENPLGSGSMLTVELPLGDHAITLLVGDQAGARDTDELAVAIVDTQPPVVISAISDPACAWSPDHRYVQFRVGQELQVTAIDACDPSPPVITIAGVVSSEPDDGATDDDVVFDATTACLRAERTGSDEDRIYTVTLAVADENGHTTLVPVEVAVPHDVREHPECKGGVPSPGDADEDAACRALAAMREDLRRDAASSPRPRHATDDELGGEDPPAGPGKRMTGGCSAGRGPGPGGLPLALLASAALVVLAQRLAQRKRWARVSRSRSPRPPAPAAMPMSSSARNQEREGEMRRNAYRWATLVIGGLLAAACGTPRIAGNKTFDCLCNCVYCDFTDPFTGECLSEHAIIFGSRSCADDLNEAQGACQTACNEDSLGAKECGAQVTGQVDNSCLLGSPVRPLLAARPLAVQAPDAAHAVIDPARSSVFVTLTSDGTMGDTTASGDIWIRGGDCALGSECPVEVTWLSLDMLPLSFGGHTATGVHVDNNGKQPGTRLTSGAYLLAPLTASFNARGVLDGTYVSGVGVAGAPVSGELDFAGGTMTLSGTFYSEDGTILVDLVLAADFANQPPKADAGDDQVAECGAPILLDGTGSSDPDGAIVQHSWYETAAGPQRPFATGVSPTVNLDPGAHPITLRVRDDDGSLDTDETVVTVVDTTGPTITGVTAKPDCLWPPNDKLVRLDLGSDIVVETSDACTTVTSIEIMNVSSNEPIDGPGDGSTAPDVAFDADTVCLRSERSGGGAGRVYTITVKVTDANGNTSLADVEVSVGHDNAGCDPLPESELLEDDDPACSFPIASLPTASLAPQAIARNAPPPQATAGGGCATGGGPGGGGLLLLMAGVMILILAHRRR